MVRQPVEALEPSSSTTGMCVATPQPQAKAKANARPVGLWLDEGDATRRRRHAGLRLDGADAAKRVVILVSIGMEEDVEKYIEWYKAR